MNPFQIPQDLLNDATQPFTIERNNIVVGSSRGFFCGNKYPSTIQLVENANIKNGDWLIDSITSQRYFAKDVHPIIMGGEPVDWMVKYQTEHDYNLAVSSNRQATINIQTVNGNSVIGNQENVVMNIGATLSDIEQLITKLPANEQSQANELLNVLKTTESATHPVLVEGTLSKFSDLLKKHTDLLIAVGGWAVQLLIGK